MLQGKWFDEFEVGEKSTTFGRTITETDIVTFVNLGAYHEELFMNMDYIEKHTVFKKRIAPGALTFWFSDGLAIQTGIVHGTGMALLGMDIKIHAPVFVNDTIRVEIEIKEKRPTKDPTRGIVVFTHTVFNQDDKVVMTYDISRMVRYKP